jgi:vacuole morphology and inheritance protein 14
VYNSQTFLHIPKFPIRSYLSMEENFSVLPASILRGLSDRSYDKRKATTIEIQALVKTLYDKGEKEKIVAIINLLAQGFTRAPKVDHRKGGVSGLAGVAVGLTGSKIDQFLHYLVPPVLECIDDPEARVCYYAAETLYNIAKVARTCILRYFNQIFDALCKLFVHVNNDVKNAAALLDRLIKDIVTQTDSFDIESFVPLLQKHIKRTKPYIRQLLVSWIIVLDTVPDINMLDYLPDFLDGLFNMLSDGNREIKQSANNALSEFLREIREAEAVELGPMVSILVTQCRSKERTNRLTAMTWMTEFIFLGNTKLLPFYAGILSSVMYCISDDDAEVCERTRQANHRLMSLVNSTQDLFELGPFLHTLTVELLSDFVSTRVAALHWIHMLHVKDPEEMNKSIGDLLPALLKAVSDSADEVVLMNLQVLARICLDGVQFTRVINSLVQLFHEDRPLLESRGALVIRKLCCFLEARNVYKALAEILSNKTDLEFVSIMVQTLNLILLTAPELAQLRKLLKGCLEGNNKEDKDVFNGLYKCWTHNPVATFSLCLLCEAYGLSEQLIFLFAEVDVTVGFLMQVDKLVQMLESPIFIHLRLQLLKADRNPALIKSLYGLLMLLPQSQAYKTLNDRLSTVSSMQVIVSGSGSNAIGTGTGTSKQTSKKDYSDLLQRFQDVQDQHCAARLNVLRNAFAGDQDTLSQQLVSK